MRNALATLFVIGSLVTGCDRGPTDPSDADAPGAVATATEPTPAQLDRELAAAVEKSDAVEARAWLSPMNAKHVLWKTWDKAEARKQVEALYAAGAKQVWAVDPVDTNGAKIVAQFVVELPDAAAARAKVFEWVRQWEADIEDEEPTKDVGQKYYEINLDL